MRIHPNTTVPFLILFLNPSESKTRLIKPIPARKGTMMEPLDRPNMNMKRAINRTGVLKETRIRIEGKIRKVSPGTSRIPKNIPPITLAAHRGNLLR